MEIKRSNKKGVKLHAIWCKIFSTSPFSPFLNLIKITKTVGKRDHQNQNLKQFMVMDPPILVHLTTRSISVVSLWWGRQIP